MKNVILGLTLGAASLLTISCKKDKEVNCNDAVNQMSTAANNYFNDQSAANCKAYKSAMETYVNSDCFDSLSEEEKSDLRDMAASVSCD